MELIFSDALTGNKGLGYQFLGQPVDQKYNLSSHAWQTIKTIPKQMFEYAKDHGYIASNPFPELKVTVKFRQVSKPTSETQVYNTNEYHNIIEDLWKSYDKKHEARFCPSFAIF